MTDDDVLPYPLPVREPMNDLAKRIWDGQSISLPEADRVNRIVAALKDGGYDVAGLGIEGVNVGKYLEVI